MYWAAHRGNLTEGARRLVAIRQANVISTPGADEFLSDLTERLGRLDAIASRRERPQLSRLPAFAPNERTPPEGWTVLPLLQLHIVASATPVTFGTVGYIRPEQREGLVEVLNASAVSERLRMLAHAMTPASALATPPPGVVEAPHLGDWALTPGGRQSLDQASYRLGGDATAGISSIATVQPPPFGVGGQVLFTFDIGVSIGPPVLLHEAALLIRDALVLVTADLPAALADILPDDADVAQAEVHILAALTDGQNPRLTELTERVDLSPLGESTRDSGSSMSFQFGLSGPLTETDASEMTVAGVEYMALLRGWIDPRAGVAQLQEILSLSSSS